MEYRIIPRSEWGARHDNGFGSAPLPAREVWLHHSVTIAPDLVPPFTDDNASIRTLERIGEERFGRGISYTWCITPVGRIYEGHGVARQGAHTKGRNDISRGIVLVGNYSTRKPTDAQINAAAWLLRYAKSKGWIVNARLNGGHRDSQRPGYTECPGDAGAASIAEINRRAVSGIPSTPPKEEDDDMGVSEQQFKTWVNECLENKLGLGRGEDMALAVYGQKTNQQVLNRLTATNNPASVAAMVAGLVKSVASLTTLVGSVKGDTSQLTDDEQNIVDNANARAEEVKFLLLRDQPE